MLSLIRTNSQNHDFVKLVAALDAELAVRDGEEHAFYQQFNKIDKINHAVLLFIDKKATACGGLKEYRKNIVEIKRMYTLPEARGAGHATKILAELESWAKDLNFDKCILETGKKQPEALELYKKKGYMIIPNYGQYQGVSNSICFEKIL